MVDSMSMDDNENDFTENLENLSIILSLNNCYYKLWKFNKIQCLPGSNSGDNYMSIVKRIALEGKDCNSEDKKISLIIKRQIPSRSRRQLYRCDEAFNNEINAYKYVVPMLENSSKSIILPKCHFAGHDGNGELIILEDLKQLGFEMKNRLIELDLEHCELVMKKLAALHAASITAKELNENDFFANRQNIKEIVYCDEARDFYKNLLDSSICNSLLSLRSSNIDGCLNEPIKLIESLQTKLFDQIEYYVNSSNDKYNVLCHGDLWINNIMFKFNSFGLPSDVKFFDLQTMRYTSPVFDILHFIYTSTKRDLREHHLKRILQIYGNALIENLDNNLKNNSKCEHLKRIKEIFSLENITNQFYSHILYGLGVCMWILPAVTFDPNNIPNLNNIQLNDKEELNVELNLTHEYHSRIKDIALEFYQNGYLHV